MDAHTIQRLNDINRAFYTTTATEFDQTRGRAWPGWEMLLPHVDAPLSVLDVGCGNGRFGLFLAENVNGDVTYHGVDNNAPLLDFAQQALADVPHLQAVLLEHDIVTTPLPGLQADLVVLFGVIHHIPGAENRKQFMRMLAEHVTVGGMLCFAAWRFYEYDRFTARITAWPDDLEVEEHDYLLDWRRGEQALRYCHYVTDNEHQALIDATGLEHVQTYRADGQNNSMNNYSILRKLR